MSKNIATERLKLCFRNFAFSFAISVALCCVTFLVTTGTLWIGSVLAVNTVPWLCFDKPRSLVGCYAVYTFLTILSTIASYVVIHFFIVLCEICFPVKENAVSNSSGRQRIYLWREAALFITRKITLEEYVFLIVGTIMLIVFLFFVGDLTGFGVLLNFSLIISFVIMVLVYSIQRFFSTGCGKFIWGNRSFVFAMTMIFLGFLFYLHDLGIIAMDFEKSEFLYLVALFVGSVIFAVVMVVSLIEPGIYHAEDCDE